MKRTGITYEIRTLADFLKVPEARRGACLREFATYLKIVDPLTRLIGVPHELKEYRWTDDGVRHLNVELRPAKRP